MGLKGRKIIPKKRVDFTWITLIPTIEIILNEPIYMQRNVSVAFHFIGFHFRLLVLEDK